MCVCCKHWYAEPCITFYKHIYPETSHAREVPVGAVPGGVAGDEATQTPSATGTAGDSAVCFEAPKAPAVELSLKGQGKDASKRGCWRLGARPQ